MIKKLFFFLLLSIVSVSCFSQQDTVTLPNGQKLIPKNPNNYPAAVYNDSLKVITHNAVVNGKRVNLQLSMGDIKNASVNAATSATAASIASKADASALAAETASRIASDDAINSLMGQKASASDLSAESASRQTTDNQLIAAKDNKLIALKFIEFGYLGDYTNKPLTALTTLMNPNPDGDGIHGFEFKCSDTTVSTQAYFNKSIKITGLPNTTFQPNWSGTLSIGSGTVDIDVVDGDRLFLKWANGAVTAYYLDKGSNFDKFNLKKIDSKLIGDVSLGIKVYLQGAYQNISNTAPNGGGLMRDNLRVLGYVPKKSPYDSLAGFTMLLGGAGDTLKGNGITTPLMINNTGAKAIVDWVFIEFRPKTNPSVPAYTRSALILADGSVVNSDSNTTFKNILYGDYYIAIRHRNHLGIMTASPLYLGNSLQNLNFTDSTTGVWGSNSMKKFTDGKYGLWSGNTEQDGFLSYDIAGQTDTSYISDRTKILRKIGGLDIFETAAGYSVEDVNMNGTVTYTSSGNDRLPILQNVGGANANGLIYEQIPNHADYYPQYLRYKNDTLSIGKANIIALPKIKSKTLTLNASTNASPTIDFEKGAQVTYVLTTVQNGDFFASSTVSNIRDGGIYRIRFVANNTGVVFTFPSNVYKKDGTPMGAYAVTSETLIFHTEGTNLYCENK